MKEFPEFEIGCAVDVDWNWNGTVYKGTVIRKLPSERYSVFLWEDLSKELIPITVECGGEYLRKIKA